MRNYFLYGICAAIIFILPVKGMSSDIYAFRSLEFRGLINISKSEIIKKAGIAKNSDGAILVNTVILNAALKSIDFINTYTLTKKRDSLVIKIIEKRPEWLIGVKKAKKIHLLALDKNFTIIGTGRVFVNPGPFIITEPGKGNERFNIKSLKSLLLFCSKLKQEKRAFYNEISEIRFNNTNNSRIKMHNRKTYFYMKINRENMNYLESVTGYLDSQRYYPDNMTIQGNRFIIR